mgnify:CR=1 FL=1
MKTIRFFLLWCMVVAISACTPFYRGFEGSTLVSSGVGFPGTA